MKHLEQFKTPEGYWLSEEYSSVANQIVKKTNARNMLEIGFNIGYSTSRWFEAGIENIFSIDIGRHPDTLPAMNAVKNHYTNKKFDWLISDSKIVTHPQFLALNIDIAFIDGEHTKAAVISDTNLCINSGAKWLIYDDLQPGSVVRDTVLENLNDVVEAVDYFQVQKNVVGLFKVINN